MEPLTGDIDLNGTPNIGVNGMIAIGAAAGIGETSTCEEVKAATDDLIAMGENAFCNETNNATGITRSTPDASNSDTDAYFRLGMGCTDTDDNATDFEVREANPRDSGSAITNCSEQAE